MVLIEKKMLLLCVLPKGILTALTHNNEKEFDSYQATLCNSSGCFYKIPWDNSVMENLVSWVHVSIKYHGCLKNMYIINKTHTLTE